MSYKNTKSIISLLLCFTVLFSVLCFSTGEEAAAEEVKGKTLSEAVGIDPYVYLSWLYSHEDDGYYLGTPYKPYDRRNPNGDCAGANGASDYPGVAAMNCTGFVWHVLTKAAEASGGNASAIPAMQGWVSFYKNNNISRRYFSSKQEMLNSGYLDKGDIIWMFESSEYALSDYNHVGIYWGDGTSDVLWHSSNQGYENGVRLNGNALTSIIPAASNAQLYVVLKVGVPQVKLQLLRASADPEITDGSDLYSLEGAKYNIYTSSDCEGEPIGSFITDADGYGCFGGGSASEVNSGTSDENTGAYNKASGTSVDLFPDITYYCREAEPSKGYEQDSEVYVFANSGSVTGAGVKIYRAYSMETGDQPLCTPVYYPAEEIKGDVNGDGVLSIDDGTVIQLFLAKLDIQFDTEYLLQKADMDGDGEITISDVTYIQKLLAKLDID